MAALTHYETMGHKAEQKGERELALVALIALSAIRTTATNISDFALAEALGERALTLARELGDKVAETKILWMLLNVYRMTHRNQQAQAAGEQALTLAQALGLREQMAFVANDLVYMYTVSGDIARTFATVQTASDLWRALGNQPMLTDSLNSYAHTWATIGNFDKALECANEALQIARSLGNTWAQSYSLIPHSVVNWQKMAVDAALAAMSDSIRLGEAIGFVGAQVVMRAIQARLRLAIGDTTKALEIARTGWELAAKSAPFVYSTAAGTLALVLVCVGQLAEADEVLATIPEDSSLDIFNYMTLETALCQRFLQRAEFEDAYALSTKVLDFLRLQGVRMYIPEFLHYQAQALIGLGEDVRASEALEEGVSVLQATGARWQLWEMTALLADLAQLRGDAPSAEAWQQVACTTIEAIAGEISDVALRDTFLGQPKVVKLLHVNRDG
jgi:tetratricopeptide (TPR) repeat protein